MIIDLQVILFGRELIVGDGQCFGGTIFALYHKGIVTVLHTFDGSHGEFPVGSLMRDVQGTLLVHNTRGRALQSWDRVEADPVVTMNQE